MEQFDREHQISKSGENSFTEGSLSRCGATYEMLPEALYANEIGFKIFR